MATNVPLLLSGQDEKPITTWDKVHHWLLMSANFLSGFCCGLFLLFFRMQTIFRDLPAEEWMPISYNVAQECVMVLQIYSGFILCRSVFKIRRFFVEHNATQMINTEMLIRHSSCFILYIITVTTFYITFGYYTFKPTEDNYKFAASFGIFFNVGSCVSQILLVNIFWGLGTKVERS
jgi:hypothetical protein